MSIALAAVLFYVVKRNYTGYHSLVSVHNTRWGKVHIQVRMAGNPQKVVFDGYLYKGQSKAFTMNSGDDILYRRDEDPDHADGIHFTGWKAANCANSSACDINNP